MCTVARQSIRSIDDKFTLDVLSKHDDRSEKQRTFEGAEAGKDSISLYSRDR